MRLFQAVNLELGYGLTEIRSTPSDVLRSRRAAARMPSGLPPSECNCTWPSRSVATADHLAALPRDVVRIALSALTGWCRRWSVITGNALYGIAGKLEPVACERRSCRMLSSPVCDRRHRRGQGGLLSR
jgi:hypothetical protein